jgi:hypothetical protein
MRNIQQVSTQSVVTVDASYETHIKRELVQDISDGDSYRLCGTPFCVSGLRTERQLAARQSKPNLLLEALKFHYHQILLMAWIIMHRKSRHTPLSLLQNQKYS